MLAKRLTNFDSTAIQKALSGGGASDIIDLSIGYPIEDTPRYIKEAGKRAIDHNLTRYQPANGPLKLRQAIAAKLAKDNDIKVSVDQVTVTPGLTTAILITYLALLDPGDEVLVADPGFPPYHSLAELIGAKAVMVNTFPDFQLTTERLEAHIGPKTKVIVINSPNNPTGAIYPESELRKIADLAHQHNLVVISDEIYEYFAFGQPHFSIGSIYDQTLTFNGFSKSYAMSGWRVGYVAGPQTIIDALNSLLQYAVFSSTSISMAAAEAALAQKPVELTNAYRSKWEMVTRQLAEHSVRGLDGAFYAYIKAPRNTTGAQVAELLLQKGVRVLPGSIFGSHDDYIRIAYTANKTDLGSALRLINELYPN